MKLLITSFLLFAASFTFAQTQTQQCVISTPETVRNIHGLYPVEVFSSCAIRKVEIKVMNRWGEVIYTTTNLKHYWEGVKTPDGAYFMVVSGEYSDTGEKFSQTGYVMFFN